MGTGVTKSMVKTARAGVNKELKVLHTSLNNMKKQIELLNSSVWNGGSAANKWYDSANSAYKKDLKFYNKIINIQNEMKDIEDKLEVAASK